VISSGAGSREGSIVCPIAHTSPEHHLVAITTSTTRSIAIVVTSLHDL
jgi:hypothetical protein